MRIYDAVLQESFDSSTHSIGMLFRKTREEKALSIDDIESSIRLPKKFIHQLENDQHEYIHHSYLKGYVRAYAKVLGLSEDTLFGMLNCLNPQESTIPKKKYFSGKQVTASDKFIQWITFSIISILIILVMLWWKSDNLLNTHLSANDAIPGEYLYSMADSEFVINNK